MALTLRQIAKLKKQHPGYTPALNIVLLYGLSKQRKDFYEYLKLGEFDTRQMATVFRTTIYHASTVLKFLYDLGLIRRRCIVDREGRRFNWTAVEGKNA